MVVALPSGAVLWSAIYPGFYYLVFVGILAMYWLGLGAFLLVRTIIAASGARLTGHPVQWAGWSGAVALMTLVSVVILAKLPLRAAFAFARADLEQAILRDTRPGDSFHLMRYIYGPYPIHQLAERRCHHKDRVYFNLASDPESAFIYSTSGIDDLCYNSGSKGHLTGNWYWMTED